MLFKRAIDLVLSLLLLVLTLPLQILIALVILATMGWPVFFLQERPGFRGRPFTLIKFRTMRQNGNGIDASRVTRLGAWLRDRSLDELPELLNVVKGDMSLVGPRPLLPEYLLLYDDVQAQRHNVRPGMTGLAQVNGRNRLSWRQKFKYDVWYTKHWSVCLDFRILYFTTIAIFRTADVNQSETMTMEPFRGNDR